MKSVKKLNEYYPEAILCMTMQQEYYVMIGATRINFVELDEDFCQFRVWIEGEWYYIDQ